MVLIQRILRKIDEIYWRKIKGKTAYARHIGVKIGDNCLIGIDNWGSEPYLITIGNNVQVTSGVSFHTHGGGNVVRKQIPEFDCFGKIVVKDWAYIGSGSRILMGVTIGEGSLVAAGSVVTKSVPPHCVVGGNPARFICTVEEYIQKNLKYNVQSKGMSQKDKRGFLESLNDENFIKKTEINAVH